MTNCNFSLNQKTADLVTFTQEILNGKLHFLYSYCSSQNKIERNADSEILPTKPEEEYPIKLT